MQTVAVNHLRALSSLGLQSSGLFGDVKTANFVYLPPKDVSRTGTIRASYSRPGSGPPPLPSRGNNPNLDQTSSQGTSESDGATTFSRAPAEAPSAPEERNFTSAKPPSLSADFKASSILNQTVGTPGSPRPKPGTPRPYDPTKQKSKVMEWLTPPPPPTELLQREHYMLSSTCTCTIYFGDLSKWNVDGKTDAVIAPGNKRLNTGPAVNAVLFKAAGTRLLDATQRLPDVAPQGIKAEVGDAISTRAFNLPVARVIHAVGPVYKKEDNTRISDPDLIKAYKNALDVARRENLTRVAFPPLSCRIYGYPYSEGAEVALKTIKENCEGFSQIDIVIRNIEGYEAFVDQASRLLEPIREKKTIKLKLGSDSTVTEAAAAVIPPELAPPPSPPPVETTPSTSASESDSFSFGQTSSPPASPFPQPAPSPTAQTVSSGEPAAPAGSFGGPSYQSSPPPPPYSAPPAPPPPPSPYVSSVAPPPPPPPGSYGVPPYQQQPPPPPYQQQEHGQPQYPYQAPQYQSQPPQYQTQYPNAPQYQQQYRPPQYQPGYQNAPPPPQYQAPQPQYQSGPPQQFQNGPPPPQFQNAPPPPPSQYHNPQHFQNVPPPQYESAPSFPNAPPSPPPPQYEGAPSFLNAPPQYQSEQQYQAPENQSETPAAPRDYHGEPEQQSSSFVPPRQRASSVPPKGPPPTPPSSPTMPFPKKYEYQ